MKQYVLSQSDIDLLLTVIDRNPKHGDNGGSSRGAMTKDEEAFYDQAHRFYNYQVRKWVDKVTS